MSIVSQTTFRRAVLNPDMQAPDGLIGPAGDSAGKRFDVYRNNVAVSLTEALITAFPVIYKLVGDEFFRAMAGVYLRQHPPTSPVMMHFGQDMPGFLRGFGPVKHLGYLPDMARLELAIRAAYHSADSDPISTETLGAVSPAQMSALRFELAPTVRIIESRWPLHAIWDANMRPDAPAPGKSAQHVLVTRPNFDPIADALTPDASRFVQALGAGKTLGLAIAAAPQGFDPSPILGLLLSRHALTKAE